MPAERTVECPECHTGKATKANQGVRLACLGCGITFRCPPPTSTPPAPAPVDKLPAALEGGRTTTKIVRARPVVKQAARPRERGVDTPPPTPEPAPTPPARPARVDPTRAGRRGGLARYAKTRVA